MHAIPATVAYGHRIKFSSAFYVRCITFPSPWPLPRYVRTVRAGEARDGKPLNINTQYPYPDPSYASHNHTATLRICIFWIGTSSLIWLFLYGGVVPTGRIERWWRLGLGCLLLLGGQGDGRNRRGKNDIASLRGQVKMISEMT
jgi:hypothetical protein